MSNTRLLQNIAEVRAKYPGLNHRVKPIINSHVLQGEIKFHGNFNEIAISDSYLICIEIDFDYPLKIPRVFETGNRIPPDFHKMSDGSLCLGVELEMIEYLAKDDNLLSFIQKFVISYLYSYSYFNKYGVMPYGERSHGSMGIIEFLMEKLSLSNQSELLPIITALSSDKFRYNGKKPCPCGSGIRMSDCSHKILLLHPPHYKYARMCKKFLEEMERNEQNEQHHC